MGVSVLAAIRPDDWNLPLFLHVLAALVLIGALVLAGASLLSALRSDSAASVRLALRSLTLGVLPAWVVLRGSSEWIADKEGFNDVDEPPNWVDIGYIVGDGGFLFILISTLLSWLAFRRVRSDGGRLPATARAGAVLVALLLVANLVALWAMTTKPT
jgi:hypothetical protein